MGQPVHALDASPVQPEGTRTLAISQATLDDLAKYANIDVSNSVVSYAGVARNITALVLVGFRIEDYLRERGFSDRELADVHFLGLVPNTEMHLVYQSTECFVLASLCESFGIKILEALATGCPAIVPSTCASPEIAGGAARLINPHNEDEIAQALAEVTGSEELRRTMREKGLQRAQALTWRETARRTLAVFDEIIPGSVAADGSASGASLSR